MNPSQPLSVNYSSVTDATARGGIKTITAQIEAINGGFTLPEQRTQFWNALGEYCTRNREHFAGGNAAGAGGETNAAGHGATHGGGRKG
jgi:hypothetical protein